MTFEFWGLTGDFGFGLPVRTSGFLFLGLELAFFVWVLIDHRRRGRGPILVGWPMPGALAIAGIASQAVLVLYLQPAGGLASPGLPLQPAGPAAFFVGSIPLGVGAGWVGGGPGGGGG